MKSYKTFTPAELAKWQAEVTQYMTEVHPTLAGVQQWEDMPNEFFNPGCELAKAIVIARDAATNPKQYKPQQAVRVIGGFLKPHTKPLSPLPPLGFAASHGSAEERGEPEHSSVSTQGQSGKGTQQRRPDGKASGTGAGSGTVADDRGSHLCEYLYMLNEDVKAEAERLPELYLQQAALAQSSEAFAKTYEDAEKEGNTELMELTAKHAEPTNRELVEVNQAIRAIWAMVDECVEYYRKHGEVMPDGETSGTVTEQGTVASSNHSPLVEQGGGIPPIGKKPAECTKAEIDAIADPALQHKYMEIRIEANKKYLRRTDLQPTDEWREQVHLRSQELIDWEVKITDKIYATMERAKK